MTLFEYAVTVGGFVVFAAWAYAIDVADRKLTHARWQLERDQWRRDMGLSPEDVA